MALDRHQGCYTIHIGIEDLRFRARTPSRPTWHYEKVSRSQRAQCPNRGHRVGDVTGCKGPWIVETLLAAELLVTFGLVITPGYRIMYPIGLLPRPRRWCASGGGPSAGGGGSTERPPRGTPPAQLGAAGGAR
jgi:hypothetical protein